MKWSIWSGITKLLSYFDDIARVAVLGVTVIWLQMRKNKTKGKLHDLKLLRQSTVAIAAFAIRIMISFVWFISAAIIGYCLCKCKFWSLKIMRLCRGQWEFHFLPVIFHSLLHIDGYIILITTLINYF